MLLSAVYYLRDDVNHWASRLSSVLESDSMSGNRPLVKSERWIPIILFRIVSLCSSFADICRSKHLSLLMSVILFRADVRFGLIDRNLSYCMPDPWTLKVTCASSSIAPWLLQCHPQQYEDRCRHSYTPLTVCSSSCPRLLTHDAMTSRHIIGYILLCTRDQRLALNRLTTWQYARSRIGCALVPRDSLHFLIIVVGASFAIVSVQIVGLLWKLWHNITKYLTKINCLCGYSAQNTFFITLSLPTANNMMKLITWSNV